MQNLVLQKCPRGLLFWKGGGKALSDKLITGFFWFILIVGVLAVAVSYWILTVLIPAIIAGIGVVIGWRNRHRTMRTLTTRPDDEIGTTETSESDLLSISNSNIRIVKTDQYSSNWQSIIDYLEVEQADKYPIKGTLRAFKKIGGIDNEGSQYENVVILACVDGLVVGEVARVQIEEVAPNLLSLRGAARCVLNTGIDSKGRITSIKAYPDEDESPWWKIW